MSIDSVRLYEIDGQVCELDSVQIIQVVATNLIAIAGVANKRIRLMGLSFTANAPGTNPGVILRDGSGGTIRYAVTIPACTVGEHARPVIDSGYFSTTTGNSLYLDVITATANLFISYLYFVPRA